MHLYITGESPSSSSNNLPILSGSSDQQSEPSSPITPVNEKAAYDTEKGSLEDGTRDKKSWEYWSKEAGAYADILKKRTGRPDVKAILEEEILAAQDTVSVDGESASVHWDTC